MKLQSQTTNQSTINKINSLLRAKKKELCFIIGSKVEILDSTNKNQRSVKGTLVDETKYTIIVCNDKSNRNVTIVKRTIKQIKINNHLIDFTDFFVGSKLMDFFDKSIEIKIKKCFD